jgi:hypothetical protein
MAKKADSNSTSNGTSGTEVRVFSFAANEDAVVPDGWEIVSVEYDRQMGLTRVVAKQPYDEQAAEERRAAAAGPAATPTYPQTAGAVTPAAEPPNNSFPWGTIDTTKVQNLETVKSIPNTLLPEGLSGEHQGLTGDPAGVPAEAVDPDVSKDDVEARAEASRSEEEGKATATPIGEDKENLDEARGAGTTTAPVDPESAKEA